MIILSTAFVTIMNELPFAQKRYPYGGISRMSSDKEDQNLCPFKLCRCNIKCRANDHGDCSVLKNLEMLTFAVVLK